MNEYIYQQVDWPAFQFNEQKINTIIGPILFKMGKLLGRMESLGFSLQSEAFLQTLTINILKTSEIEDELLNKEQVRSSIARRLGLEIAGMVASDRNIDGVVDLMLDATQNCTKPLTEDRLFGWHASLFPSGRSGMYKIKVGQWRDDSNGPMQVVSGGFSREKIHYDAPAAHLLANSMKEFLEWFNNDSEINGVLKASIAHFWFITLHPFEDGNGRIARAIADLQLARADGCLQRFYSMSAQIQKERNDYYGILEQSQKGSLDITNWHCWFLNCLNRSLEATEVELSGILQKAKFWELYANISFNNRQNLMANKMLDGFQGNLTTAKWAKITKCSHDTALRDILDLIEKGVLIKQETGGRSTAYSLNINSNLNPNN